MAVVGVIVAALGSLSYQAFAAFHGTAQESISVSAATMSLGLQNSRLTIDATNLNPGDDAVRAVDLVPSGSPNLQEPKLTTTATVSSDLDTDTTFGLQLMIERCSVAWDETLDSGVPTGYSCSGSTSIVLGGQAVIGSDINLGNLSLDAAGGAVNHLVIHLLLPNNAPDSLANLSSTIQLTFSAVQPSAGLR